MMLTGAVLLLLLVVSGAELLPVNTAQRPKRDEAKRGEVFTWATPPMALPNTAVRIYAEIPKPTPKLYCPEVKVDVWVRMGSTRMFVGSSTRESDCGPWRDQPEIRDRVFIPSGWNVPFLFVYQATVGRGCWEFKITLTQGEKKVRRTERVDVQCPPHPLLRPNPRPSSQP